MNKIILATLSAILFMGTSVLTSCNKDDDGTSLPNFSTTKNYSNIPHFSSIEEVEVVVNTAISFDTISDLIIFEKEQGRRSIGVISDVFYEEIDKTLFTDKNDVWAYVEKYEDLLDTTMINDEMCVLPKFFNTPYRYVANSNGMFSVGEMYYKLFKTGIVVTTENFVDKLSQITDEDLENLDTAIFRYVPDEEKTIDSKECMTKWKQSNNPTSSKDRIHIEIISNTFPAESFLNNGIGDFIITRVKVYNLHKFLGVWWTSRHNLSCKGTIKFHIKTKNCSDWEYVERSFERHQKANTMWIGVYEQLCYWDCLNAWDIIFNRYNKFYHYDGFSIDAWYPGHAVEHFSK